MSKFEDPILDQPYNDPFACRSPVIYGSFGNRFVAAILDGLIVGIPMAGINFFILGVTDLNGGPNYFSSAFNLIVNWLYFAYMESSERQATIGKAAMNLKVTDMNGQRIDFGRASIRQFSKILSGCMLLIGYIMAAFTDKKQALHDIIAGTLVLDTREYY